MSFLRSKSTTKSIKKKYADQIRPAVAVVLVGGWKYAIKDEKQEIHKKKFKIIIK